MYKIMIGKESIDSQQFFKAAVCIEHNLRSHHAATYKRRSRLDIQKQSFSNRVICSTIGTLYPIDSKSRANEQLKGLEMIQTIYTILVIEVELLNAFKNNNQLVREGCGQLKHWLLNP